MNTIEILQQQAKRLRKSPGRRDLTFAVYQKCVEEFGSFNNAKEKAELKLQRRSPCKPLTEQQKEYTQTLAKIVSYLTFDGHLCKNLKGFFISSNNIVDLLTFEEWIIEQFAIKAKKIEQNKYCLSNRNYKIWFFNTEVSRHLYEIGTPKGNKILTEFRIPEWIRENKEFARAYIAIAYLCEGTNKEKRPNPSIKINQYKNKEIIKQGLEFMEDLKNILSQFNIRTGKTSICKGNLRKDGIITKELKFKVSAKDNSKFYSEIGWLK
ncbi:hypothetical protein HZA98_02240 [Candidatus Woesearchaeota archaeon]|nr:hypothetical protein [Candidatus Woesearchaeota archaeon]